MAAPYRGKKYRRAQLYMVAHLRLVMLRAVRFLCLRARGMAGGRGMTSMCTS